MTEKPDQAQTVMETLTDEDQKALSRAIGKVEAELFHRVLKRLSACIAVVLSIMLIGGLINLGSCYSNVENSAATKLTNDPELRDKIIARAQDNLTQLQERFKTLNERAAEIERANARASEHYVDDLERLRQMVETLNIELLERRQGLLPRGK